MPAHRIIDLENCYEVDDNGCWIWRYATITSGYGLLWLNKKFIYAHRWSYEKYRGPIPSDLQIDHLCENKSCINPDHLEAVTQRENILRGKGVTAVNARKTHCIHGHLLQGDNLYIHQDNRQRTYRKCRVCALLASKKRYYQSVLQKRHS